jgi:hypothetical protein
MEYKKTVLTGVVGAPYEVTDGKVFLIDGNGRNFDTPSEMDADWVCSVLNDRLDTKGVFKLIPFALNLSPSQFMRDRDGSMLYFIQGEGKVFTTTSGDDANWLVEKLSGFSGSQE